MMFNIEFFNLRDYLKSQREWSLKTFGPGELNQGISDHIKRELREIKNDPGDWKEWIDLLILAFDGALRKGVSPDQIIEALFEKQIINCERKWPDWKTVNRGKAIEHIRK